MTPLVDLTGKKYGRWTVLQRHSGTRNGRTYWLCACNCGERKAVLAEHLKRGNSKSCGCILRERRGPKHPQWTGAGEISGRVWAQVTANARRVRSGRARLAFGITIEAGWSLYLKQRGRCALSGLPISFIPSSDDGCGRTASLDRIDSSLPYTEDNVQWVHKDVNIMKNKFSEEYFFSVCDYIMRYQNEKEN